MSNNLKSVYDGFPIISINVPQKYLDMYNSMPENQGGYEMLEMRVWVKRGEEITDENFLELINKFNFFRNEGQRWPE